MADIVGSNYNITDFHGFGGLVCDETLDGFLTGSQFGGWMVIEDITTLKQQQLLGELSYVLRDIFRCHIGLKSHVVAVGMGVENGINPIKDGFDVFGFLQRVIVSVLPLRQIMAEVYQYL